MTRGELPCKNEATIHVQDTWGNAVGPVDAAWNVSLGAELLAPGLQTGNTTVLQQQDALGELTLAVDSWNVWACAAHPAGMKSCAAIETSCHQLKSSTGMCAGRGVGAYVMVLATTAAGTYFMQALLNEAYVSTPQVLSVAVGPAQLNRCVLLATGLGKAAQQASLMAAQPASLTLNASDRFGNVFSLADYLQVSNMCMHETLHTCWRLLELAPPSAQGCVTDTLSALAAGQACASINACAEQASLSDYTISLTFQARQGSGTLYNATQQLDDVALVPAQPGGH